MVSLADIPDGSEERASELGPQKKLTPKINSSKRTATNKLTPAPDAAAMLMKELDSIGGKQKPKSIHEMLGLLEKRTNLKKTINSDSAFSSTPKTVSKNVVSKKEPIREDTLGEETPKLKASEETDKSVFPEIKLPDNLLAGLEDIKIQDKATVPEATKLETPEETLAQPMQYAKLEEMKDPKQVSKLGREFDSLIRDLESLDQSQKTSPSTKKSKTAKPELVSETQPKPVEQAVKAVSTQKDDTFSNITKKIPIPLIKKAVEIEVGSYKEVPSHQEFVSQLRTEGIREDSQSKTIKNYSTSGAVIRSQALADPLSLYVGRLKKIIDSHWKIPLGTEHKKEIVASFFLYSGGNIDKPQMRISSGTEQLDSMAIKAILDSVPFPKFSEELRSSLSEPNLHITMHFKLTTGQ